MKKFSHKAQKKMAEDATRGKWYNLVQLGGFGHDCG